MLLFCLTHVRAACGDEPRHIQFARHETCVPVGPRSQAPIQYSSEPLHVQVISYVRGEPNSGSHAVGVVLRVPAKCVNMTNYKFHMTTTHTINPMHTTAHFNANLHARGYSGTFKAGLDLHVPLVTQGMQALRRPHQSWILWARRRRRCRLVQT